MLLERHVALFHDLSFLGATSTADVGYSENFDNLKTFVKNLQFQGLSFLGVTSTTYAGYSENFENLKTFLKDERTC